MSLLVRKTKTMGRGIVSNGTFKKGQLVEVSPCIEWGSDTEKLIQETDLKYYVFSNDQRGSVLALGLGSLFNHSPNANVSYKYNKERNEMKFYAKKAVHKGEELFIDYGYNPVAEKKKRDLALAKKKSEEGELKKLELNSLKKEIKIEYSGDSNANKVPGYVHEAILDGRTNVPKSVKFHAQLRDDKALKPTFFERIYDSVVGVFRE